MYNARSKIHPCGRPYYTDHDLKSTDQDLKSADQSLKPRLGSLSRENEQTHRYSYIKLADLFPNVMFFAIAAFTAGPVLAPDYTRLLLVG